MPAFVVEEGVVHAGQLRGQRCCLGQLTKPLACRCRSFTIRLVARHSGERRNAFLVGSVPERRFVEEILALDREPLDPEDDLPVRIGHDRACHPGGPLVLRPREGVHFAHRMRRLCDGFEQFVGPCLDIASHRPAQLALEHTQRVAQSVDRGHPEYRVASEVEHAVLKRQEVPGEIAAIHAGYVKRAQGNERRGVVPVVEVPAITVERTHGRQRGGRPLDQPPRSQVSEVISCQGGQETEAHVGRRRTARHGGLRHHLHVVRREPMVVGAHMHLEERPRAPCKLPQESTFRFAGLEHFAGLAATHPPCKQG